MKHNNLSVKWWVKAILFTAFLYSVVWGAITIFLPNFIFISSGLASPNHQFIWQVVGIVEITLGIGYLLAMADPYRQWIPIFLGLFYKTASSAVLFLNMTDHSELWSLSNYIFIDNIIWLLPFGFILYQAYRHAYRKDESLIEMFNADDFTLDMFETSEDITLQEMTERWPTMVVFLRHFGCTFCRETMGDLARLRHHIEANGTRVLLVHMLEDEDEAHEQIAKYGLSDLPTISDPEGILYKKFQLRRGTLNQLFGFKVWVRGVATGIFRGYGIGKEMGDSFQMPGIFLLFHGQIVKQFVHQSAADKPPYLDLADCSSCQAKVS